MKRWWVWLLLAMVLVPGLLQANPEQDLAEEARRQTDSIRQGGAGWPITETQFFRLRIQPGMVADPVATAILDSFTLASLTKLGFTQEESRHWREHKWDYYLCDDATVKNLTGYSTKGMADLAGRAIISSHFPHFHELVHLLADQKKKPGASQTHPLIQEGLASLMGGRWGRSPEVVMYTGWVMHHLGMVELESVLTAQDFRYHPAGADATYPQGAAVCEVVRRYAGWPGVMNLNRQVSGNLAEVEAITSQRLAEMIGGICDWAHPDPLQRLIDEVDRVLAENRRCGIEPLEALPDGEFLRGLDAAGGLFIQATSGDDSCWRVFGDTYPVVLLSWPTELSGHHSSLFSEHLPDQTYEGQRYGLKCSLEEVGFYDYGANQLIALWVGSFTGEMFKGESAEFKCSPRIAEAMDRLRDLARP